MNAIVLSPDELQKIIAEAAKRAAEEAVRIFSQQSAAAPAVGYYTAKQAAEVCGVTPQTISNWKRTGKIRANKTGHIPVSEIARLKNPVPL